MSIKVFPEYCVLSQATLISEILVEYDMVNEHPCHTPVNLNFYDELKAHRNEPMIQED
jgi:hypothetical protein